MPLMIVAAGWQQTQQPNTEQGMPPARQVLARAAQAMGGTELIESIKSIHTQSHLSVILVTGQIDTEAKINSWWMAPNKIKVHQISGTASTTYGSNGTTGWQTDGNDYEILDKTTVDNLKTYGCLHALTIRLQDHFQIASTTGAATIAGTDCYAISLSHPDSINDADRAFFSASTGLLRALQMQHNPDGMESTTVTYLFDDWKTEQGLKLFRKVTVQQSGTTLNVDFVRISLNTVKPSQVSLPEKVQEKIQ